MDKIVCLINRFNYKKNQKLESVVYAFSYILPTKVYDLNVQKREGSQLFAFRSLTLIVFNVLSLLLLCL